MKKKGVLFIILLQVAFSFAQDNAHTDSSKNEIIKKMSKVFLNHDTEYPLFF